VERQDISIEGGRLVTTASKSQRLISSQIHFVDALFNLIRMRSIVAPAFAETAWAFGSHIMSFLAVKPNEEPVHWTNLLDYVEGIRDFAAANPHENPHWKYNPEVFQRCIMMGSRKRPAMQRPMLPPAPRPSRTKRSRDQRPPSSSKDDYLPEEIFQNVRSNGLCLNFQKGRCPQEGDHLKNRKMVKHECAHRSCKSKDHGYKDHGVRP
jgi:hypothetical protein